MKISWTITACCAAIASAVPLSNKASQYKETDLLNFILSLERFQDAFYRQGLANFTQTQFAQAGYDADFYSNLTELASQEHTHVTFLTSTIRQLNATPVAECEYNFNVTNPSIFVVIASLLEAVSVSSDIGLLAHLQGSTYMKVLASSLAVEARHLSFIRGALGEQPFSTPYDTPTDLNETYTLIQLFSLLSPDQSSCSQGIGPFLAYRVTELKEVVQNLPTLSSSYSKYGVIGREVTFVTYGKDIELNSDSDPLYAAFLTLSGPVFTPATRLPNNGGYNFTVPAPPEGYAPINGLTYVVLSSSNTTVTDETILAGPATIEIHLK